MKLLLLLLLFFPSELEFSLALFSMRTKFFPSSINFILSFDKSGELPLFFLLSLIFPKCCTVENSFFFLKYFSKLVSLLLSFSSSFIFFIFFNLSNKLFFSSLCSSLDVLNKLFFL